MADTIVYKYATWPYGMIGPCSILWQPIEVERDPTIASVTAPSSSSVPADSQQRKRKRTHESIAAKKENRNIQRKIWLRFHPGMFEQVWENLGLTIEAYYTEKQKHPSNLGEPFTSGQDNPAKIEMKDLRGELNAFEVMGPKAQQVLKGIASLCKTEGSTKASVSDIARRVSVKTSSDNP